MQLVLGAWNSYEFALNVFDFFCVQLALANPGCLVIGKLDDAQFLQTLGSEWVFLTVGEGIQVCKMLLHRTTAEREV